MMMNFVLKIKNHSENAAAKLKYKFKEGFKSGVQLHETVDPPTAR